MKKMLFFILLPLALMTIGCSVNPDAVNTEIPTAPLSVGTLSAPDVNTDFDTNALLFTFEEPVNIDTGTVILVSSNIRPIWHNGVELYNTVQFIWMSNNTVLYIKDQSLNIAGIQEVELRNFYNKDKSKKLDYFCEGIFRPEFTGYIETVYDVQTKKLKITFPKEIKSKPEDIIIFVGGVVVGSSAKSLSTDTRSIIVSIDMDDYPTIVVDKLKFFDGSVLNDKVVHQRNILPPFVVPVLKGFIPGICTNRLWNLNEVNLGNPNTIQKYRYFDFSCLLKRVRDLIVIVNGTVIGEWHSGINFNEQKTPLSMDKQNVTYSLIFHDNTVTTYNIRYIATGYNGQKYETNYTFAIDSTLHATNKVEEYEPVFTKTGNTYNLTGWNPSAISNGDYIPQSDLLRYKTTVVQFGDNFSYGLKAIEWDFPTVNVLEKSIPIVSVNTNFGIVTYKLDTEMPCKDSGQKKAIIINYSLNSYNTNWKTIITYPKFTPYAPPVEGTKPIITGSKSFKYDGDIYAFDGASTLYYTADKFYPVLARTVDVANKAYVKGDGIIATADEMNNYQEVGADYHSFTTDIDGKMSISMTKNKGTIVKSTTSPLYYPLELGFVKSFNPGVNDGKYLNNVKVFSFWSHFPNTKPYISIRISDFTASTPWTISGVGGYRYLYLVVTFDKEIVVNKTYYGTTKAWNVNDPACTINLNGIVDGGTLEKFEWINFIKSPLATMTTPPPTTNFQNAWVFKYPIYYGKQPGYPLSSDDVQLPYKPGYGLPSFNAGQSISIARVGIYDYQIKFKGMRTEDVYGQPGKVTTTITYDYYVYINDASVLAMLGATNPIMLEANKTYSQTWDYKAEYNTVIYNRVSGVWNYLQ